MGDSRLTALILSAALTLSLALPARAAEADAWLIHKVKDAPAFADTAGSWCQAEVETVYAAGLMEGQTPERFNPQGTLMPEHITAVCARLHSFLTGGDGVIAEAAEGEAWYQPYYDSLARALSYEGGADALTQNFRPGTSPATRGMFVELLSLTLEAAKVDLPRINAVTVLPDSADPAVLDLCSAGILTGTDPYGTFDADGVLNRGQAAAMLARLVDPERRQRFTPEPLDACRDILGLDPYAAALTIDGVSIRADVMTPALCSALKTQYNRLLCDGPSANHLEAVLPEAIAAMKEDLALEHLAAERGVTIAEEDLEEEYGPMVSGYRGLSESAQRWENTHQLMKSRLLVLYAQQYGSEAAAPSPGAPSWGAEKLGSALEALAERMSVQTAPELEALDLAAAQGRLVQSPLF